MPEELAERIPLFTSLPPDEIQRLGEIFRLNEFPADAILFREGDRGDRLSIVLEGQVEIIKMLGTPDERILSVLGPGDIIGEMSLLYPDRSRSASARARTPARLLEITQAEFDALLHRQPLLAFGMLQEMIERLRHSEDATVQDLKEKNRQLALAYQELKAAQELLIEKEKLEHELHLARKIQEETLPKEVPALPGWQFAAYWQPARSVGGDFYDFIHLLEGQLGLVIGDVSGKGVPAALVMATTRSVIRAMIEGYSSPGELLARVNNLLRSDMPANMFVTCLFAVLDPASGHLRYANAGHNLPYQCTAQGVIELRATGMPLGLLSDMSYEEKETVLSPGEVILLFSDGLVEAHNAQREMYGVSRLKDLLAGQHTGMALIQHMIDQLAMFTGPGWEQEDDITLVTLERT